MESILKTLLKTLGYPVYVLSVPANGTYPCIVYQRIDTLQNRSHSGNSLEKPRFQISCWGKTYDSAKTVAEAVKAALDLYKTNFKLVVKDNELDDMDVESNNYRKILDFFVWN